jgi:hypothetical protein
MARAPQPPTPAVRRAASPIAAIRRGLAQHLRALAGEARRRGSAADRFEREALERRLLELRRRLQAIREHVELRIEDLECERDELDDLLEEADDLAGEVGVRTRQMP